MSRYLNKIESIVLKLVKVKIIKLRLKTWELKNTECVNLLLNIGPFQHVFKLAGVQSQSRESCQKKDCFWIFRSTLRQSRPYKAGRKYPSVRTWVRTCVRTSVRPSTKSFFDFNDIWHVGRGRPVMHDCMQYDPIQGQGQGHESFKVGNRPFSKAISSAIYNGNWQLTTDS